MAAGLNLNTRRQLARLHHREHANPTARTYPVGAECRDGRETAHCRRQSTNRVMDTLAFMEDKQNECQTSTQDFPDYCLVCDGDWL